MKQIVFSFFLCIMLVFSGFITVGVFAQTDMGPDIGNVGIIEKGAQTPLGGDEKSTFEPGVGGGPGETITIPGATNELYWFWLAPLLAIPLLYFVWRNTDETSSSRGFRE